MDLGQLLGYSRGEWDPAVQVSLALSHTRVHSRPTSGSAGKLRLCHTLECILGPRVAVQVSQGSRPLDGSASGSTLCAYTGAHSGPQGESAREPRLRAHTRAFRVPRLLRCMRCASASISCLHAGLCSTHLTLCVGLSARFRRMLENEELGDTSVKALTRLPSQRAPSRASYTASRFLASFALLSSLMCSVTWPSRWRAQDYLEHWGPVLFPSYFEKVGPEHALAHTHAQARTYTHTHAHIHAHTHAHTHTYTRARIHTHTRTRAKGSAVPQEYLGLVSWCLDCTYVLGQAVNGASQ
eukprot:1157653-Pelagomonas_calceolata.AAC.4